MESMDRIIKNLVDYELVCFMSGGGWGSTYRIRNTFSLNDYVLKIPNFKNKKDDKLQRFARKILAKEGMILSRLSHPNIIRYVKHGIILDDPYLIEEYIEGLSLHALFQQNPDRPNKDETIAIILQVLSGLDHAHKKGFLNRDISPLNIMVSESGQTKLLDFGNGGVVDPQRLDKSTAYLFDDEGFKIATWPYLAPERDFKLGADRESFATNATIEADIYSVGIVFARLLTHKPASFNIKENSSPVISEIESQYPNLVGVVRKCLDWNPAKRYSSASEMRNHLLEVTQ